MRTIPGTLPHVHVHVGRCNLNTKHKNRGPRGMWIVAAMYLYLDRPESSRCTMAADYRQRTHAKINAGLRPRAGLETEAAGLPPSLGVCATRSGGPAIRHAAARLKRKCEICRTKVNGDLVGHVALLRVNIAPFGATPRRKVCRAGAVRLEPGVKCRAFAQPVPCGILILHSLDGCTYLLPRRP